MERVEKLLSEEEVDKRIADLGAQISKDYEGKSVHLICVLKGGAPFMCELAKRITVPVSMDFMSVSSYGGGTESSGVVKIVKDLDEPLVGKDVIIVEAILLRYLRKEIQEASDYVHCSISLREGLSVMLMLNM